MIKKHFILLCFIVCLLFSTKSYAANGDTVVYRTRTGECYHNYGCSYLKSCIETTLEDAVTAGLRPCSRCNPPKLVVEYTKPQEEERAKPSEPKNGVSKSAMNNSEKSGQTVQNKNSADSNASNTVLAFIGGCAVTGVATRIYKGSKK